MGLQIYYLGVGIV